MHTAKKKKTVFRYLLIYNIIILIFPAIIGLTTYIKADKIVEDVITAHANMTLKQSQAVVDERLKQIKEMALNISKNRDVLDFSTSIQEYKMEGIYANYLIHKTLQEWIIINGFVDSISIYYHKPSRILSSEGNAYTLERFLSDSSSFASQEPKFWEDILLSGQTFSFVPIESKNADEVALTYLQNIPFDSPKVGGDKLIICMSRRMISDVFFSDTALGDSLCFIADDQNRILYQDGNAAFSSIGGYNQGKSAGNEIHTSDTGEQYMISHVSSKENKWQYVSAIPLHLYMKTSHDLKVTTILLTAISMAIGVALCLVFAKKSYQPVKKISQMVENDVSGVFGGSTGKNEWNTIENAIMEYKSSTLQYERQLSAKQAALRENVLCRLLMNRPFDNMSKEQMLNETGLTFPYKRFTCAILDITAPQKLLPEVDKKTMCDVIENIAIDIGQLTGEFHVVRYWDQSYTMMINLNDAIADVQEELSSLFFLLVKLLEEHLSLEIVVSVGGAHGLLDGIANSFSDAMKTRDYRRIESSESILFYQEIGGNGQKYYYPISVELQLIQYVKNGESDKVTDLIEQLATKNFSQIMLSADMCKCFYMEMLSTAIKILDDVKIELAGIFPSGDKPFDQLMGKETPEEMVLALKDVYHCLCKAILTGKVDNGNEKCAALVAFLEENSCDPNLCLTMIADAFQMNQAYLSFFFRENTGETIGAFIRKLKIGKTKELLKTTNLPLGQIAEQVGYSNSNVLIRNFRKEEGITPTQYRENLNL